MPLSKGILACLGLLTTACAAPARPQAPDFSTAVATSGADPAQADAPPVQAAANAGSNAEQVDPLEVQRAKPSRLRLPLPHTPAFTDAELPGRNIARYKRWRQTTRIHVGQSHLRYAAFTADERLIVAQSAADGKVRVYERASRKLLAAHDFGFEPFEAGPMLAWNAPFGDASPAASHFALATPYGLELFTTPGGARVASLIEGQVHDLDLSPDRRLLVTLTGDAKQPSTLRFYLRAAPERLMLLGELPFDTRVDAWALSHDNRLLALAYYPEEELSVVDLQAGTELFRLPTQDFVGSLAFSPDGRWLAVGGQGLLLIDLLQPALRAYYSYYYNNINTVRFSPSGDVLATSSYDGFIRLFSYGGSPPSLELVHYLRHSGQANVYRIEFDGSGDHLLSSSGDQTLRVFGNPRPPAAPSRDSQRFLSLAEWRAALPPMPTLADVPRPSVKNGHYHPPLLDGPARPSRIAPGQYACRITSIYKLRDCTVTKTPTGHTVLEFLEGNLLSLKGVLYDDGAVVRYEAWQTSPSTVVGCDGCQNQPLHAVFRGRGKHFTGLLTFRNYYDPRVPPPLPHKDVKIEEADDRFPLTLTFKGPLPKPKPGHDAIEVPLR